MFGIIGIAVTLVMVFGGYLAAGGKMGIILHSLPYEMIIIGGAAVGAFLLSNDTATIKHTLRAVGGTFKGSHWKGQDYQDLLC
ncbi:MAG: motility-associated protein, partial [Pseudomonadota bacterium]